MHACMYIDGTEYSMCVFACLCVSEMSIWTNHLFYELSYAISLIVVDVTSGVHSSTILEHLSVGPRTKHWWLSFVWWHMYRIFQHMNAKVRYTCLVCNSNRKAEVIVFFCRDVYCMDMPGGMCIACQHTRAKDKRVSMHHLPWDEAKRQLWTEALIFMNY